MLFRTLHRRILQKRFYIEGAEYFVTSVTRDRYPYFNAPQFAQVLVEDICFACELKELELFGYTVMPDHLHILFRPLGRWNYSEVIGSLKRNANREINDLISAQPFVRNLSESPEPFGGDDSNRPLHDHRLRHNFQITKQNHPHLTFEIYTNHFDRLESIRRSYQTSRTETTDLPQFRWQKSFRDHVVRDQRDFENHIEYICNNALKHELVKAPDLWPWMWIVGMPSPLYHREIIH